MKKILIVFISFILLIGCSSQPISDSTSTKISSTSSLPNGINQEFYNEVVPLIEIIHSQMSKEKVIDTNEFNQLVKFGEKYPKDKLTNEEYQVRDAILAMGQTNLDYVSAKLNDNIVKTDELSKEYAFQYAKITELLNIKR